MVTTTWKTRARVVKDRTTLVAQLAREVAIDPRYGVDDAYEHLRRTFERPAPSVTGLRSPAWEQRLHERLGVDWPCACEAEFESVWQDIGARLRAAGLRTGRGAYAGWDDGDRAVARAVWCAVRHLQPKRVVETGVARGVLTSTILEAMASNGGGRLWSIDMPLLLQPELAGEVGVAVAPERRDEWTLIRGSSRQRLAGLLDALGPIELFVHDSLHTERNMRFELEHAWPSVRPGGAVIVDDVHFNAAFHSWGRQTGDASGLVCLPDDELALFAVALKQPTASGKLAARRPGLTRL